MRRGRSIWRWLAIALVPLLGLYVGSYLALSLRGRYEPSVWGLNGVKWYSWAPAGFVEDLHWNHPIRITYLPLYCLDTQFWHREGYRERDGKYPIHWIEPPKPSE
jgi:hypothetical protein